ncbi:MAG: hypothetical protein WD509_02805 [Candidatus Paceibacterota bacterium]
MESIREIAQKIKYFLAFPPTDLLIVAIIILVGVSSFGLGRLSVMHIEKYPVTVKTAQENAPSATSAPKQAESTAGEVVGSKNGTKYHFPWCSGAKRIAVENLVTFPSIEDAQKTGYTPAGNCKGLE